MENPSQWGLEEPGAPPLLELGLGHADLIDSEVTVYPRYHSLLGAFSKSFGTNRVVGSEGS